MGGRGGWWLGETFSVDSERVISLIRTALYLGVTRRVPLGIVWCQSVTVLKEGHLQGNSVTT